MSPLATVLYEDQMQAGDNRYPMHDLVLAMVGDHLGRTIWDLKALVRGNPRKGINKIVEDVEQRTDLFAGGGLLCVLLDRDRVAEHVGLPKAATDTQVVAELDRRSNAPTRLRVFFLYPNMEGLLRSIAGCDISLPAPTTKQLDERDINLSRAAHRPDRSVRACIENAQPGLAELAKTLAALIPSTP